MNYYIPKRLLFNKMYACAAYISILDRSKHTFRAMKMGRDYVEKFLKEHYGQEDISIERLTTQFIQEFSIWLSADKGLRGGTV